MAIKPKRTTRPPAKPARARETPAHVDAPFTKREAKAALAHAKKGLIALLGTRRRNEHAIGRRLNAVDALELFRAGGYGSLGEWAQAELDLDAGIAYQLARVAGAFDVDIVVAVGADRLDRGLAMIAKMGVQPEDLLDTVFEVPSVDGASIATMPFRSMNTAQTKRAVRHANGKREAEVHLGTDIVRAAARAERSLDAAVGKQYAVGAHVSVGRAEGEAFLEVRRIPWASAPSALRAIADALEVPKSAAKPRSRSARTKKPRAR